MEGKNFNIRFWVVMLFLGIFVASCSSNDSDTTLEAISPEEALALVEMEDLIDEADNIVDDFLITEELSSKSGYDSSKSEDVDCRTKTIVIINNLRTVTLDFGTGCTMPNGNVLSGKIEMTMELDIDARTRTITITYLDFFVNDKQITGSKSMIHMRQNDGGNPQSVVTYDITVLWPDGQTASREGSKTREWVSGHDTRRMSDNVYLITGNWEVTFKDGTVFSTNVVEELRREMSCRFLVSGILEIEKRDRKGSLNFGDGTCDDVALFTDDLGVETEIVLKGRKR